MNFVAYFSCVLHFSPSGSQGCWNLYWRDPLSSSVNLSASSCWTGKGCIVTTCYSLFMPVCLPSLQHRGSLFGARSVRALDSKRDIMHCLKFCTSVKQVPCAAAINWVGDLLSGKGFFPAGKNCQLCSEMQLRRFFIKKNKE